MQKGNGRISSSGTRIAIRTKPDIFLTLFLGSVSSMVGALLMRQYPQRWFKYLAFALAFAAFIYVAVRILNAVVENNVLRERAIEFTDAESELKRMRVLMDKLKNENRDLAVSEATHRDAVQTAEVREHLVSLQEQRLSDLRSELEIAQERSRNQETMLGTLGEQSALTTKTGLEGYLENMQNVDFSEFLTSSFVDSRRVYILASRAYTILGPEIDPFHSLFASMRREYPAEQKDIRVLLADPAFNLERTERIMDLAGTTDHGKVMESYMNTIEQILEYKKYSNLNLRIYHETASWRLILFDDLALLSSYRRVKRLPILILRPGSESLYEGFLYYFEKLYEVAEEITGLDEYRELVRRSSDLLKKGQCELRLTVKRGIGI